ncbi:hypothetical protein D9758_016394 [Tetrapyrgos nigripes]|uniref:Uncharacterized protein n=1 Tax=Tetrapyrgos nigripes TaxID=182062 RepID=A0A8H5C7R6_9AGAR|nr:hypothetical protein D9758_016394 [Tetrapyrgos nigripes]
MNASWMKKNNEISALKKKEIKEYPHVYPGTILRLIEVSSFRPPILLGTRCWTGVSGGANHIALRIQVQNVGGQGTLEVRADCPLGITGGTQRYWLEKRSDTIGGLQTRLTRSGAGQRYYKHHHSLDLYPAQYLVERMTVATFSYQGFCPNGFSPWRF